MNVSDKQMKKSALTVEAFRLFGKTSARWAHSHISSCFKDSLSIDTILEQLSEVDVMHCLHNAPHHAAYTYLASEIFSKVKLNFGKDLREPAVEAFLEGEQRCYSANQRFSRSRIPERLINGVRASDLLFIARKKVSDCLKDFSWDEVALLCDFGPGANVGLTRALASKPNKVGLLSPTVTEGCDGLVIPALKYWNGWHEVLGANPKVRIVDHGRFNTVPKNYKTDRPIMIEPLWNSFFQKGIGSLMKRRLRGRGVNLFDQTPNQEAALQGSKDGSYATIDLKGASDSVAKRFVEWMLPTDWFDALVRTRTPKAVLPSGDVINLQKFSSMGNGYTFELESLLFWSLCEAVYSAWSSRLTTEGRQSTPIRVYGDDIAVDARVARELIELLSYCGFETNTKKTHIDDSGFRESCGKHYYRGSDITPFYIRNPLMNKHSKLLCANNATRWAARVQRPWGKDSVIRPLHEFALSHCGPIESIPLIPDGFGDGGLVVDLDFAMAHGVQSAAPRIYRKASGCDGFITEHYPEIPIPRRPKGLKGKALKEWYAENPKVTDYHLYACLLDMDRRYGAAGEGSPYTQELFTLSRWKKPLLIPSHLWQHYGPWT